QRWLAGARPSGRRRPGRRRRSFTQASVPAVPGPGVVALRLQLGDEAEGLGDFGRDDQDSTVAFPMYRGARQDSQQRDAYHDARNPTPKDQAGVLECLDVAELAGLLAIRAVQHLKTTSSPAICKRQREWNYVPARADDAGYGPAAGDERAVLDGNVRDG